MNAEHYFDAIKTGVWSQIEPLLAHHPTLVNARDAAGISAVMTALYYDKSLIAERLIAQGAALDIFEASAAGHSETVRTLLDTDPSQVDAYSADGFQPLGLAVYFGHSVIAALLLERGAPVNTPSRNAQRVQPLHSAVAAKQFDLSLCKLLIDFGADVNAVQADGFTPLHGAAQSGHVDLIRLLLAHGANPTAQLTDGSTPYNVALKASHGDAAALLQNPS